MKYEIMTFKLLQYHIVKYDTMANIDYIFYLHGKNVFLSVKFKVFF